MAERFPIMRFVDFGQGCITVVVIDSMLVTGVAVIQELEGRQVDPLGAQRASVAEQLARAQLQEVGMGHADFIRVECHIQWLALRENQARADGIGAENAGVRGM